MIRRPPRSTLFPLHDALPICLNPVLTVGRQIGETLQLHQNMSRRQAEARAVEMLRLVGIPEAQRRVREYPHQLSDRKSTRLNSSHANISYAVFCLKKKNKTLT